MQDEAEHDDEGEDELIEIVHTEEGTSVRIEDVTALELVSLIVIVLAVVSVAFFGWRRSRDRSRHYSLDQRRDRRERRLP